MDYIFSKAYSKLFHFILGVVFASTIMIIPTDYSGLGLLGILLCPVLFIAGALLGWSMIVWKNDINRNGCFTHDWSDQQQMLGVRSCVFVLFKI